MGRISRTASEVMLEMEQCLFYAVLFFVRLFIMKQFQDLFIGSGQESPMMITTFGVFFFFFIPVKLISGALGNVFG